jgi:hypothetical protein
MSDKEKKELEVVTGDGSNLDISPVYEDINATRPKPQDEKPKNIVIPEEKKDIKKKN